MRDKGVSMIKNFSRNLHFIHNKKKAITNHRYIPFPRFSLKTKPNYPFPFINVPYKAHTCLVYTQN